MLLVTARSVKWQTASVAHKFTALFLSTSVPAAPPNPSAVPASGPSANGIDGSSFFFSSRLRSKRRRRGINSGPSTAPAAETAKAGDLSSAPAELVCRKGRLSGAEFANLPNVLGNILAVHCGTLLYRHGEGVGAVAIDYPWDASLLAMVDAAASSWYRQGQEGSKRLPPVLSIHGPSRRATWQMAQWVAQRNGSHLAIVPAHLFQELLVRLQQGVALVDGSEQPRALAASAKGRDGSETLSEFILKNFRAVSPNSTKAGGAAKTQQLSRELSSALSRASIQLVEYLFGCMESLLCPEGNDGTAELTLLLDNFEDFMQHGGRKGGEQVLRDVHTWAKLFEGSGRRVVFGQHAVSGGAGAEASEAAEEEAGEGDAAPPSTASFIVGLPSAPAAGAPGASGAAPGGKSPLHAIADFILGPSPPGGGASGGKGRGAGEGPGQVALRADGAVLRVTLVAPKADRRVRHQFAGRIAQDRSRDQFDGNVLALRQVAASRWGLVPEAALQEASLVPSGSRGLWEALGGAGGGVLQRRRLSRDELQELLICVQGQGRGLTVAGVAEALGHAQQLRHDPHHVAGDELGHLLGSRGVGLQALSKYERRFVGCVATQTTGTRFADVCLPGRTVEALRAVTTLPLQHPELFMRGVLRQSMTGVLLFGPPGTGKTMLARAVAQESGALFLAVSMSNIFDMWVGEGEKNVKGLFSLARKLAPSIVFVDEIDALLEKRTSAASRSSRLEVVNEFMSQWDGLAADLNQGVLVLGATNRPFALDDAVLRRLPRRLLIDLPDASARARILQQLLREDTLTGEARELLGELGALAEFYSGSDLKNVALSAGLRAAQRVAAGHDAAPIIGADDLRTAFVEVPASLSEQMDSLTELRRWNDVYGEARGREGCDSVASLFGQRKARRFGFA